MTAFDDLFTYDRNGLITRTQAENDRRRRQVYQIAAVLTIKRCELPAEDAQELLELLGLEPAADVVEKARRL